MKFINEELTTYYNNIWHFSIIFVTVYNNAVRLVQIYFYNEKNENEIFKKDTQMDIKKIEENEFAGNNEN